MLPKQWILALVTSLVFVASIGAQTPDVDALVKKLGSPSYVQREQARKELEAMGTSALDALRKASATSDAETKRRLADLISQFEEQVLTQQILAPKEVELNLTNATPSEAVQELVRTSGYQIQIMGDATKYADNKINLKGKHTFWQALDKICEQGGLMEKIDMTLETAQPQIMPGRGIRRITPVQANQPAGPMILVERSSEKSVVSYAGAVKTEMRVSREVESKNLKVLFIVSAEPRLLNHMVQGRPVIEKLLDDQNRKLRLSEAPKAKEQPRDDGDVTIPQANRRVTQVFVKDGEQAARQLKEIAGRMSLQVDLQNVLLAKIGNVMEASGKSVNGANGGTLKVTSVSKADNGEITVQVSIENLGPNPFGNNIIIGGGGGIVIRGNINGGVIINGGNIQIRGGGNGNRDGLPDLLDAKGQKFKLANVTGDSFNFVNGMSARQATLVFQANPGQAAPSELVVFGIRTHTIAVPFRFENIPLP